MKTHDCSRQGRQGRQGRGGRFDIVPNVEMFLDPWKAGGSLTFRHYAECRNEGLRKSRYLSEDFTTLAPLDLPPPKQGCCSAGGGLVAYAKALCQMSKCSWIHGRQEGH